MPFAFALSWRLYGRKGQYLVDVIKRLVTYPVATALGTDLLIFRAVSSFTFAVPSYFSFMLSWQIKGERFRGRSHTS